MDILQEMRVFTVIIALLVGAVVSNKLPVSVTLDNIRKIVHLRSGDAANPLSVWYHRGLLRNPASGSPLAGVEGLEICKYIGRKDGLFNESYLSKKIFIYTDMGVNVTTPLREHRIRWYSPRRKVDPVKHFADLVTISGDPDGSIGITIEFPSNRTLATKKVTITATEDDSANSAQFNIVQFVSAARRKSFTGFSRWISFGSADASGSGRSQEYYTLSKTRPGNPFRRILGTSAPKEPLAKMSSVRYGESPSWLGSRKPCSIELTSLRYRSLAECPSHIISLVDTLCPTFLGTSSSSSVGRGDISMESFRQEPDLLDQHQPWYTKLKDAPRVARDCAGSALNVMKRTLG